MHYFSTGLLYSRIFLGLFAVNRYYLGYFIIAIEKLMTLEAALAFSGLLTFIKWLFCFGK